MAQMFARTDAAGVGEPEVPEYRRSPVAREQCWVFRRGCLALRSGLSLTCARHVIGTQPAVQGRLA